MGTTSSSYSRSSSVNHASATQSSAGRSRFQAIADNFSSLDQVQAALRRNGLESSNLIVAMDFTKSNEWTGKNSFQNRSLHWLGHQPNPYEQAATIIAKTLATFDDDGLIPVFGFGDATTQDQAVFSLFPHGQPAPGLDALVMRYKEIVPHVRLAGPTSFAPAIYQAMKLVVESGSQYHILLILADGQVTRSVDMPRGQVSNQEQATIDAIVAASNLPLSIVMVGLGDGPWDVMREFDDMLPERRWDNFQFVNFTEIAERYAHDPARMEAVFATNALMEIPDQFKAIQRLRLLGSHVSLSTNVRCLEPPGLPMPPPTQYSQQTMQYAQPPPQLYSQSYPMGPPPAQAGFQTQSYPQQAYGTQHQNSMDRHSAGYAGYSGSYPSQGAGPSFSPSPSMGHGASGGQSSFVTGPAPTACQVAAAADHPRVARTSAADAGGTDGRPDPLFVCPITQEIMRDPVIAADGYTYDRASITEWLRSHDTSPMTNERLPHKNLTTNHALRSSILDVHPNV